tara:strand:- start:54 stop:347 length:294 start_codon:yes stop_codon:yes gene_type:complete
MWNYIKKKAYNVFISHPEDVCMTYLEHSRFSLYLSAQLTIGALQAFIHAIIPVLFKTSSSDLVTSIETTINNAGCRKYITFNEIVNVVHDYPDSHYY